MQEKAFPMENNSALTGQSQALMSSFMAISQSCGGRAGGEGQRTSSPRACRTQDTTQMRPASAVEVCTLLGLPLHLGQCVPSPVACSTITG